MLQHARERGLKGAAFTPIQFVAALQHARKPHPPTVGADALGSPAVQSHIQHPAPANTYTVRICRGALASPRGEGRLLRFCAGRQGAGRRGRRPLQIKTGVVPNSRHRIDFTIHLG